MNATELRRRSLRRAARAIAATVFAVAGATWTGGTASACSGPFVTAVEAIEAAPRIALVTTVAARGDAEFPDAYDFAVEEAYRGAFPPLLQVDAPQYHACGDRIVAAPGDRLVIFFDVPAFSGQPPMNPYWRVDRDGALAAEGIDDAAVPWRTLADLRAAFAGEEGAVAGVGVTTNSDPLPDPWFVPVVALVVAAGVVVFGLAYAVRR